MTWVPRYPQFLNRMPGCSIPRIVADKRQPIMVVPLFHGTRWQRLMVESHTQPWNGDQSLAHGVPGVKQGYGIVRQIMVGFPPRPLRSSVAYYSNALASKV